MLDFNEDKRLETLHQLEILDTPPEPEFNDMIQMACEIAKAKMGAISLVDDHRQWFKAKRGVHVIETPRESAFCAIAIREKEPLIIDDASKHPQFKSNPLVTGAPFIRFYAGFQLQIDGFNLGTLCVFDSEPQKLDDFQYRSLKVLARQVAINFRFKYEERVRKQIELQLKEQAKDKDAIQRAATVGTIFSATSHELTAPVSLILLRTEKILGALDSEAMKSSKIGFYTKSIEAACHRLKNRIQGLRAFGGDLEQAQFERAKISEILKESLSLGQNEIDPEIHQSVTSSVDNALINCRPTHLSQAIAGILKHAHDEVRSLTEKWISLRFTEVDDSIEISISDSRLAAHSKEPLTGDDTWDGLIIARGIVAAHGSELNLDRTGINMRYYFRLKKVS